MPFFGIPNPIKGIRNQVRRASNFIAKLKNTPDKPLLIALSEGDEEKAMKLYMEVTDGVSLIEDWNPSDDALAKAFSGQVSCKNIHNEICLLFYFSFVVFIIFLIAIFINHLMLRRLHFI